jgi:hypothetical protein
MIKYFLSIICIFSFTICFSQKTTYIGKCKFYYEKVAPSYSTIVGSMKVYHNGDFKQKGLDGKYNIWSCSGTVWVIFNTREAAEKNKFIVGNVQTCNNF